MNYKITTKKNPNRVYIELTEDTIETRIAFIDDLMAAAENLNSFYFIITNEKDPITSLSEFKNHFPDDAAYQSYMAKYESFMNKVILLISIRTFDSDAIILKSILARKPNEDDYCLLADRNIACYKMSIAEELIQKHIKGLI